MYAVDAVSALPRHVIEPEKKPQGQRLVELIPDEALFRSGFRQSRAVRPPVSVACRASHRAVIAVLLAPAVGRTSPGDEMMSSLEGRVMQIWVDADACPAVIKEILFRAADRTRVPVTLVSNMALRIPTSPYIKTVRVPKGFNVADKHIADLVKPGDLVVTADIPLAADVVARGGHALNPRGELYTEDNVQEHLAVRTLMDTLRVSGDNVGGPAEFSQSDRHAFANHLDRLLTARGPS